MRLRNGPGSFGGVSRGLHWIMAAGILGMLGFGTWLARTSPSFGTLWLYGLHKSLGITLLALVLLRLAWHRFSPAPPILTAGIAPWQLQAARIAHAALYVLMLAVPLSGWVGASATGIDTVLFGRIVLPRIAPATEAWDRAGFAAHGVLTKLLAVLVLAHAGGALWRHLVHRDATLRRMLGRS